MHRVISLLFFIAFTLHTAHSRVKRAMHSRKDQAKETEGDPCAGLTYCTVQPHDYPQDMFNEMFKNHTVLHQPDSYPFENENEIHFSSRFGDEVAEDQCESIVEYAYLYQARESREDAWQTVIQVPAKNFEQKVRMEHCKIPNGKCFTKFPEQLFYKAECHQKHTIWQVLVYNPNKNNKIDNIKVTVPSCCSCFYKEVDRSLVR